MPRYYRNGDDDDDDDDNGDVTRRSRARRGIRELGRILAFYYARMPRLRTAVTSARDDILRNVGLIGGTRGKRERERRDTKQRNICE